VSCEFLALLSKLQTGGEEAVFGEALFEFVLPSGAIGVCHARLKRRQVMRRGQQSGDSVLREPCGTVSFVVFVYL
jgi:hypothetical protein